MAYTAPEAAYRSIGDAIDYTPSVAVAAGEVIELGDLIGVAVDAIAANVQGSLQIEGVFNIKKDEAVAFSAGDVTYWNAGSNDVDATATSTIFGRVIIAALAADTHVLVKKVNYPGAIV